MDEMFAALEQDRRVRQGLSSSGKPPSTAGKPASSSAAAASRPPASSSNGASRPYPASSGLLRPASHTQNQAGTGPRGDANGRPGGARPGAGGPQAAPLPGEAGYKIPKKDTGLRSQQPGSTSSNGIASSSSRPPMSGSSSSSSAAANAPRPGAPVNRGGPPAPPQQMQATRTGVTSQPIRPSGGGSKGKVFGKPLVRGGLPMGLVLEPAQKEKRDLRTVQELQADKRRRAAEALEDPDQLLPKISKSSTGASQQPQARATIAGKTVPGSSSSSASKSSSSAARPVSSSSSASSRSAGGTRPVGGGIAKKPAPNGTHRSTTSKLSANGRSSTESNLSKLSAKARKWNKTDSSSEDEDDRDDRKKASSGGTPKKPASSGGNAASKSELEKLKAQLAAKERELRIAEIKAQTYEKLHAFEKLRDPNAAPLLVPPRPALSGKGVPGVAGKKIPGGGGAEKRRREYEEEEEEDDDSFVEDDENDTDYRREMDKILGRSRRPRYAMEDSDDDMEASYADIEREEAYSKRKALEEELEEERREAEEEARRRAKKKLKSH